MQLIDDPRNIPPSLRGAALSFGFFDGVHRGHRAIIERTRRVAGELGVPSMVLIGDRRPASSAPAETAPRLLTDPSQKLALLEAAGIDVTCVAPTGGRPPHPVDHLVRDVAISKLRAHVLVAGRHHRDAPSLLELGDQHGLRVELVEPVDAPGVGVISGAAIRDRLRGGDVTTAAALLGRPYEIHGVVERGDGRGRAIGVPTANVAVSAEMQLPADGVYAGRYRRADGERHPAAISIGRRPTFHAENALLLVEAHLLDFNGDLYGEHAWVEVDAWLREQVRFDRVDALVAQMQLDVAQTRSMIP
ncbi:MAG: bifunctional riboflavin kinase/FAD synthetase [Chloroflexi bacterium]|nr:MAG: bifunctional riboflavin kinase/FAD synthetase [Chloroflexota bacterium]